MKITPKMTVTTSVFGAGVSHSRTDISVRDVASVIDEPEVRGGTNAGPAPTETALAALAGCTNVIANKCAAKLDVDIGYLSISIDCLFDRRGVTLTEEIDVPFRSIEMVVEADGSASEKDLARVAAEVAKFCPVAKLFRQAGTKIDELWKKAET
ncbi:OsmC family protein [Nisaea sp.]|uniref:OsmC family protein n=1 Tax=Nisaea sp. TaxID=2024842 RepID=UPI002B2775D3|nr:OsmC family protein [Nisaea sp.]